ncbi:MAG: type II toxin-antitoxin system HicA family toxin [Chloroflexi bacterium]|nr:type II toxin-antitoxin system HicA family toxin [Chloroflexota bacterium]
MNGSHFRLRCPGRAPVTVPRHRELDRGTLRIILRTAGLSVDGFVGLLRGPHPSALPEGEGVGRSPFG